MALTNLTNSTSPNTVERATADGDAFDREHVNGLAQNFDEHDHTSSKGLAVGRVQTSSAPAQSGQVRVNGDNFQWWGASAGAVRTAVDTASDQTIAGEKVFSENVGLGVVPAAFGVTYRALQVGGSGALYGAAAGGSFTLADNAYYDGTDNRALITAASSQVSLGGGTVVIYTAPSATAGDVQTFTARASIGSTGTLTLTPEAGQPALTSPGNLIVTTTGTGRIVFDSASDIVGPNTDNQENLGYVDARWAAVYAVNGTIQTSSKAEKDEIAPLDPERALAVVRATDLYEFTYKGHERRHVGFYAEDVDALLSPDHASASPQTTAAVALAAVKALDARLTALEAA